MSGKARVADGAALCFPIQSMTVAASPSNVPAEKVARPNRSDPASRFLLALPFIVDAIVSFGIYRVYTRPRYLGLGSARNLLLWALALDVAAAALVVIFLVRVQWRRRDRSILLSLSFLSLVPFVLMRCLRISGAEERNEAFGLSYAFLIFATGLALLYFVLSNVQPGERKRPVRLWVLVSSVLIYMSISPWASYAAWPTSDEPNYLTLTHSLAFDHDVDLRNNLQRRDYWAFYPFDLSGAHVVTGIHGEQLLWHDVGMPLLLVPGYWAGGLLGTLLEMNLFTGLMMLGIFELALDLSGSIRAATSTWAVFVLACPVFVYTVQIFPELLGAAFGIGVVAAFSKFERLQRPWLLLAAGCLAAYLPWLCIRFWMLAIPMLGVMSLYILLNPQHLPYRNVMQRLGLLVAPIVLGTMAFGWLDHVHFGTWLPNAGYLLYGSTQPQFSHKPFWGFSGLMLDRTHGLLPVAPIYLVSIAAIGIGLKRHFWSTAALIVPCFAYVAFMSFSRYWWAGRCSPGRYVLSGIALLIPLACLLLERPIGKIVAFGLGILSLVPAFVQTAVPQTRYDLVPDISQSAINEFLMKRLDFGYTQLFPSFIHQPPDYTLGAVWLFLAAVCIYLLNHVSHHVAGIDQEGTCNRKG